MLKHSLQLPSGRPARLLCIGAHGDDLEIGCGGTVSTWLETWPSVEVTWVVLTAVGERAQEARRSARALLRRSVGIRLEFAQFDDGFLPARYADVKRYFEQLKRQVDPDVVLTHRLEDRHQDHRLAAELTWNTWRDHLIYEYEIPKYEGDLGQPNVYVPLTAHAAKRKTARLERYFRSQRGRAWFRADNFQALMRLRGVECRAPSGFAEAFYGRKLVL
jgi:LmbE family N-acetylglucosaminyl deacetylase